MEDLFKKFLYTGVGLVALTAERLQQTIEEMVDDGKLSKEEGKKVFGGLLEKTESTREEFEERFKAFTSKVIEGLNIPTRDEMEALQERVAVLEAKLEKATTAKATAAKTTAAKATAAKAPAAKKTPAKRTVKKEE
jgi:polyhydroxyalkanoate synthesis regulator phasin